jgi:hypothetical protein
VYTPFAGIGDGSFHLVGRLGGMVGRGADVSSLYDLRYHFLDCGLKEAIPNYYLGLSGPSRTSSFFRSPYFIDFAKRDSTC